MTDWAGFADALGGVPVITEPALVRQKSRDFFWYSPILKAQLNRKSADLVVCPRDEAEVIATVALCAKRRVNLTVRGAGTGNYGQAVPLEGGVVMDMTGLDRIVALEGGLLTVEAGRRMIDIDLATRPDGWELRTHPSTKRTATIGGFVGGGSGGVGSVSHGGLRDRGNIISARVVSCEEVPRVVELVGDAVAGVNHAYGTTGVITSLQVAMAPVQDWVDVVVGFDGFMEAARFGMALALSSGIAKKLVTAVAAPVPESFRGLEVPAGKSVVIAMVARPCWVAFEDLLRAAGGVEIARQGSAAAESTPGMVPFYEYTWNHTTLHMLRKDKGVTYLQCLYPADRALELVERMTADFAGELMQHLEFQLVGGRMTCSALPVIRYTTEQRLAEIVAAHEAAGVMIANPHYYTLEDGAGHKRVGETQPAMKAAMDPYALLNPGKMRSYQGAV
jgi:FAD/FMN-containing dehydrogenase